MLSAWLNMTIRVQRRNPLAPRNVLNEPAYGDLSSWPIIYDQLAVRIEYIDRQLEFNPTGERDSLNKLTVMYVEAGYYLYPEDRVLIQTNDDPELVSDAYIVMTVYPEWNSVGNVHHYIVEIQVP